MTDTNTTDDTMTSTMTERVSTAAERYLRFWNTTDLAERDRLAAETFDGAMRYHAPVGVLEGAAGLAGFADEFRRRVGAADVVALEPFDHHHDRVRLRWELRVDGASFAAGTDVLVIDEAGRVREVTTFLDRAPEGFVAHAH